MWLWQEQGPVCACGRPESEVPPQAVMLPAVLAVLVVAQCPIGMWGGPRAGAPSADWAREGAWLCWSLTPVAVLLPAGRCLGTEPGPALGLASSPVGSLLSSCCRGGSIPRGRELLCVWRDGLTPRSVAAAALSVFTLTAKGHVPPKGCTTGSCCSAFHLMCFRVKGKHGEWGGTGVCISHLSLTRAQETWAGAVPVTWGGLLGLVSLCLAAPSLGSAPRVSDRAERSPWLLWTAHLDAAAPAFTLPAAP